MTQKERLLDYFKKGMSINRLQGWEYLGILELPARVTELKQDGHNIETKRIQVTNRFGEKVSVAEWSMETTEQPLDLLGGEG